MERIWLKENKLQVALEAKELVEKGLAVRLSKTYITPSKRTVIACVGIAMVEFPGTKIVRSQRTNGSEISRGALSSQEDSIQAEKYLRKKYAH